MTIVQVLYNINEVLGLGMPPVEYESIAGEKKLEGDELWVFFFFLKKKT